MLKVGYPTGDRCLSVNRVSNAYGARLLMVIVRNRKLETPSLLTPISQTNREKVSLSWFELVRQTSYGKQTVARVGQETGVTTGTEFFSRSPCSSVGRTAREAP